MGTLAGDGVIAIAVAAGAAPLFMVISAGVITVTVSEIVKEMLDVFFKKYPA